MHAAHAFVDTPWFATISESFLFLGLQEFELDGVEVLGVSLGPLEVGLLVSHGELLEILSSLHEFLLGSVFPLSFMSRSPEVVLWIATVSF
jgi:hypothetical protein